MIFIVREDSIELLPLSTRTYNCLRRNGIDTVGQLLDAPPEQWKDVRNLGKKSLAELEAITAELSGGSERLLLVESRAEPDPQDTVEAAPESGPVLLLPDIPIEELGLPTRALRCLSRVGIHSAAQLSRASKRTLMELSSMGEKTACETLDRLSAFRRELGLDSGKVDTAGLDRFERLGTKVALASGLSKGECLRALVSCYAACPDGGDGALLDQACLRGPVRSALRRKLLARLEATEAEVAVRSLLSCLPEGTDPGVLEELLAELEERLQVRRQGDMVERRYPTIIQYAERLPDGRNRSIFLARLRGEETLEELGQRYGITRERVRQITEKVLEKCPRLHEERYQYLFEQYEISCEEFQLAFDEPEETYHFLEMLRTRGSQRRPVQELLEDSRVPVALRRKAERAIYRKFVTIGGVRIGKNRSELVNYTVRTYCRELTSMEDFVRRYQLLLETLGLENNPGLDINERSYENKISRSRYVLWNQRHSFRYYPIGEREYDVLLDTLDLPQYDGQEFSTLKLFRENPKLMEEYDIRDEYELHNLLRKVWPEEDQRVRIKKMPTIEIGTADRDSQVLELLAQCAPISNLELAERYEQRYGAKSTTVLGSYFTCIDCYLHNGIYNIDQPPLPEEQHRRMAELLTEDFYRISEIKRIYLQEFPGSSLPGINSFMLKKLGFRIYTDYVLRDTCGSAAEYFRGLLTAGDIVDMSAQAHRFAYIQAYYLELSSLKAQRKIVEFAPLKYISLRRLQSAGITVGDLEDYCSAVYAWGRPGSYFTIASLRKEGFSHPLDETGFEDWFYASLLGEDPEHFSYRRMGGTKLFCRGKADVQSAGFLRWLVEPEGRMDIYDLSELLEQHYGVSIPTRKLIEIIRGSDLYYDAIMEAVYVDYDTYFEEV